MHVRKVFETKLSHKIIFYHLKVVFECSVYFNFWFFHKFLKQLALKINFKCFLILYF